MFIMWLYDYRCSAISILADDLAENQGIYTSATCSLVLMGNILPQARVRALGFITKF